MRCMSASICRWQYLRQHEAALKLEDVWDLMAPLWQCDRPLERIGFVLDGGG